MQVFNIGWGAYVSLWFRENFDNPGFQLPFSGKTQPVQCKPPPSFNAQKVVKEIHSRSPADEMKDDSKMLKDPKAQEIQRPSVPPRTSKPSSKEPPKPAARPVPGKGEVLFTLGHTWYNLELSNLSNLELSNLSNLE